MKEGNKLKFVVYFLLGIIFIAQGIRNLSYPEAKWSAIILIILGIAEILLTLNLFRDKNNL